MDPILSGKSNPSRIARLAKYSQTLPGLVAYYPLNELGGNAINRARVNKSVVDGIYTNSPILGQPGKSGRAVSFNGSNYVAIPREDLFDFTTPFSIGCIFNASVFDTTYQTFLSKGDSAFRFHRNSGTNQMAFGTSGLSNIDLAGNILLTAGTWYFGICVYDGKNKIIYNNGNIDVSLAVTGTPSVNNFPLYIGENAEAANRKFKGLIQHVFIANSALSPLQVARLAKLAGFSS